MFLQVSAHIVLQPLPQCVEGLTRLVVVALKLGRLHQLVKLLLRHRVIVEATIHHTAAELLPVVFRQMELCRRGNLWMAGYVIHHIVEQHLGRIHAAGRQVVGNVGHRIAAHLHVGGDTAAIAYLTPAMRVEHMCQRVGRALTIGRTLPTVVVDGLDAAPRGYVVFRRGNLHVCVVRQIHRHLHQALSIRARTYNDSAIEVLQRTCRNLARRGRLAAHQHSHGHHRIYRFQTRLVGTAGLRHFTTVLHYRLPLRHPQIDNVHGLRLRAASVAAQVEHQCPGAALLQVHQRPAHLFSTVLRKLVQVDISYLTSVFSLFTNHSIIRQLRHLDVAPRNLKLHLTYAAHTPLRIHRHVAHSPYGTQHLQHEARARVAAQM